MRTDEYPLSTQAPDASTAAFILALGRALHQQGAPAHRLENALSHVSQVLGLEARFYSTPTSLVASFGRPEELKTCLLRIAPSDLNLDLLARLDRLATQVIRQEVTPEDGARRIDEILARPPPYPPWLLVLSYALAGGAGARLFGGGLVEIAIASLASLCAGALEFVGARHPTLARMRAPLAAFLASSLATLAASRAPVAVSAATLGGVFVLLPGLTLTVAMTELSTQHLLSGSSRLMGGALVLLQLLFGAALGAKLSGPFPPVPQAHVTPPGLSAFPALLLLVVALGVLLRADVRDWGWIALASAGAYVGARVGSWLLGPDLGAFAGAVLLAAGSNLLARLIDRPALITIVPGLLLLVPGSVGFQGLQSLLGRDVIAGVDTLFWMLMIAVSLGAGLLFANVLVPPRKVL